MAIFETLKSVNSTHVKSDRPRFPFVKEWKVFWPETVFFSPPCRPEPSESPLHSPACGTGRTAAPARPRAPRPRTAWAACTPCWRACGACPGRGCGRSCGERGLSCLLSLGRGRFPPFLLWLFTVSAVTYS